MRGANRAQITSKVSIPTGIQGILSCLSRFPALSILPVPEAGTNRLSGLDEAKAKHHRYGQQFNPTALGIPKKKAPRSEPLLWELVSANG